MQRLRYILKSKTRVFFLQAYHRRIKHPQYVLLTLGRFRNNWWRQEIEGLTCTADQRELVMTASLAFTENYFIDEERDADIVTTSGLVSNLA